MSGPGEQADREIAALEEERENASPSERRRIDRAIRDVELEMGEIEAEMDRRER